MTGSDAAAVRPPRKPRDPALAPADRQLYFEDLFAREDPWNYGSAYEEEKYLRQLAILPEGMIGKAMELACAEGHFTVKLAPFVGHLLATDISPKALERAARRCAQFRNIDFQALDFAAGALPGGMDLVICSEVLYYLSGEAELRKVAAKIAAALRPGGCLVSAHARMVQDDACPTGFDFGLAFGAGLIHRVLSDTPGLALERAIETDLYRIERFCLLPAGAQFPVPVTETLHAAALEPEIARFAVRGEKRC